MRIDQRYSLTEAQCLKKLLAHLLGAKELEVIITPPKKAT
jgi:hypothetical protein